MESGMSITYVLSKETTFFFISPLLHMPYHMSEDRHACKLQRDLLVSRFKATSGDKTPVQAVFSMFVLQILSLTSVFPRLVYCLDSPNL